MVLHKRNGMRLGTTTFTAFPNVHMLKILEMKGIM